MTFTLRELVQIPQIANMVVAGNAGLDRPVVWAHASEMRAPWDWIGPDELLMTIGFCVPRAAAAQVDFVEQLARSGLAGIAISDDGPPPPLTRSMLDAADRLAFPILRTGYSTPFSVIARAVASANQHEQLSRLARLSRLSTELARPARPGDPSLLSRIAAELGHTVHVVDARHGTEILPAACALDPRIGPATAAQTRDRIDQLPARVHVDVDGASVTCYPVPSGQRPAMLVVPDDAGRRIDPFAVLHVANLVAVELDRLATAQQGRRRRGTALLEQLLDDRIDRQSAIEQLQLLGLDPSSLVVTAVPAAADLPLEVLLDRGVAHLSLRQGDLMMLVLGAGAVPTLCELLPRSEPVGSSDVLHSASHLGDAVREARWALDTARAHGGGHVAYADSQPMFLPRTVTEAINATREVLGPLLDHDASSGSELVRSLEVYLTCDRSWKQASAVLHVHRQTLGYRLHQVETLTCRNLRHTSDIADLWFALLALRIVEARDGHVGGGS